MPQTTLAKKNKFMGRPPLAGALLLFLLFASACTDSASRAYERGMSSWRDGDYNEAVTRLRAITQSHPDSPYAPMALHKVAQIQNYHLRKYDESEQTYQLFLKLYAQSSLAERALEELIALLFDKKRDYQRTINESRRFSATFPASPQAPAMYRRIVLSHLHLREFEQARTEAELFLRKWPEHALADVVGHDIVRSHFIEGKNSLAVIAARRQLEERAESTYRGRTTFLMGAALEDMDHLQEALDAYIAARDEHPEPAVVDAKISAVRDRIDRKHN
jgi:outer membrane protein assembly factor BamD (BamD/ComL family)